MIPVTQTRIGSPNGNCFAACLASILEEKLPEFGVNVSEDTFWRNADRWLARRGLRYVQVPYDPSNPPKGWGTVEGTSPRGGQHACVAYNGRMVHDPHPVEDDPRRGLVEPRAWGLLLPLGEGRDSEEKLASVTIGDPKQGRYGREYALPKPPPGFVPIAKRKATDSLLPRRWLLLAALAAYLAHVREGRRRRAEELAAGAVEYERNHRKEKR